LVEAGELAAKYAPSSAEGNAKEAKERFTTKDTKITKFKTTNFRNLGVLRALRGEKIFRHTVQAVGTTTAKVVQAGKTFTCSNPVEMLK